MLGISNLKSLYNKNISSKINTFFVKAEKYNDQIKNYLPSTKEWYNSIYAYNKSALYLLPVSDKVVLILIKIYFNLYSKMLNFRIKYRKLRIRVRRKSSNRIYVSKAEFKHTFDNLEITFYLYNRQMYNFLSKIKKRILRRNYITLLTKNIYKDRLILIKRKSSIIAEKIKKLMEIEIQNSTLYFTQIPAKKLLSLNYSYQKKCEDTYNKFFVKKFSKREILHIYFDQIVHFNKSKLNNTFLHILTSLIRIIYNKNIKFKIISLKYFFLNSDIFSDSITLKLKKRKNRLLRVLKKSLEKVKISESKKFELIPLSNKNGNTNVNTYYTQDTNIIEKDPLNILLFEIFSIQKYACYLNTNNRKLFVDNLQNYKNFVQDFVLNSFKRKAITGVRLEAAGRLSRRITASRSVFKVKYKGSLINIDSSYKGIPSAMVRGHVRPNLQYSVTGHKTRIGAFGLKSWINSNNFSTKVFKSVYTNNTNTSNILQSIFVSIMLNLVNNSTIFFFYIKSYLYFYYQTFGVK